MSTASAPPTPASEPRLIDIGLARFALICFGQLISLVGSGLSGWALGIWTYQQTGSATLFGLISVCTVLPGIALSPLAGALVDRWDRRTVMLAADAGAGLCTLILALLFASGRLAVWQIYIAMAVSSACAAFHWPAYMAAIPLLVPARHLGRAVGFAQSGHAAALVLSPALAGLLIVAVQLQGLLLIDVATFLCAVATMLAVRIPALPPAPSEAARREPLAAAVVSGWAVLRGQPGMLALLALFGTFNLLAGMIDVLVVPLFLSVATPALGGVMMGAAGTGMLAGTLLLGVWGGPQRRADGMLGFMVCGGLCLALMGLRPSLWLIALGGWGFVFCVPLINGCYQTILYASVAPERQGRAFATSRMLTEATLPLAYLIAGPLADRLAEPALAPGGWLAGSAGRILGVGPGRGIALLFVMIGFGIAAAALAGRGRPQLRQLGGCPPARAPLSSATREA